MLGSLLISNSSSWLRNVPLAAVRRIGAAWPLRGSCSKQNGLYNRALDRSIPKVSWRSALAPEQRPGRGLAPLFVAVVPTNLTRPEAVLFREGECTYLLAKVTQCR